MTDTTHTTAYKIDGEPEEIDPKFVPKLAEWFLTSLSPYQSTAYVRGYIDTDNVAGIEVGIASGTDSKKAATAAAALADEYLNTGAPLRFSIKLVEGDE